MKPVSATAENFINFAADIRVFLFFQHGEDEAGALVANGSDGVIVPSAMVVRSNYYLQNLIASIDYHTCSCAHLLATMHRCCYPRLMAP